ncbi:MAG: biotin/lipoyl-containing protein, partial [Bacteroidota bacterium]
ETDVMERGETIAFPESVKNFFRGDLGQPHGGFPKELQKIVLKGDRPYTDRPNAHLIPIDFERELEEFQTKFGLDWNLLDFLAYKLYPKVWEDYHEHVEKYGEVSKIPTSAFFYPLKTNEEIIVKIEEGKNLLIRYMYTSEPDDSGERDVFFAINGQTRVIKVKDQKVASVKPTNRKAENENEIGTPLQGRLVKIFVKEGDQIEKNDPLFVIEAMKMESTITAPTGGKISKIHLAERTMVEQDDLVVEFA